MKYQIGKTPAPLTDAGWPRPTVKTNIGVLPVPWSAPPNQLSVNDDLRASEAGTGQTCQVCGLAHKRYRRAYVFIKDRTHRYQNGLHGFSEQRLRGMVLEAMDRAVMHKHCAILAATMCPRLRELQEKRQFAMFSVPTWSGAEISGERVRFITAKIIK